MDKIKKYQKIILKILEEQANIPVATMPKNAKAAISQRNSGFLTFILRGSCENNLFPTTAQCSINIRHRIELAFSDFN